MEFDPKSFQEDEEQRSKPLEEIAGSEIAVQTLKSICETEEPGNETLKGDILKLYQNADQIEQETLGSGTGQEGRQAVNNLVTRYGETLFEELFAEAEEGGGDV